MGDEADPEELLRAARAGDGDALGRLLESHRPYLTLLARGQVGRRLRAKADPADLVQEAFASAHLAFPQFRGTTGAEFAAWVRQILAAHVAGLVRHYHGTKRRDVRLEREVAADLDRSSHALGGALAAPHSTPSQQAARREQAVLLAGAIDRLPEHYREVIVLRHVEGLSVAEAAARLGRTEDAVQKVWMRALVKLRQSFGGSS